MKHAVCLLLLLPGLSGGAPTTQTSPDTSRKWPYPVPCRIQDGANPDLLVMTLGPVATPLAQGTFDPLKDEVALKDGSVKSTSFAFRRGSGDHPGVPKKLTPSGMMTPLIRYWTLRCSFRMWNAPWRGCPGRRQGLGCASPQPILYT